MKNVISITILLLLCMCHATELSKPLITNTTKLPIKQFLTTPNNFLLYPGRDVFQEYTIQFFTSSKSLLKFVSHFKSLNSNFDFEKFLPPQRYISAAIANKNFVLYFFSKEKFPNLKPILFLPEMNEGFAPSVENESFILYSQTVKPIIFFKILNKGFYFDGDVLKFVMGTTEMEQFPNLKPILYLPELNEGFVPSVENEKSIVCSEGVKPILFLNNLSKGYFVHSDVLKFVKSTTEIIKCNDNFIFMKNDLCYENSSEFFIFSRSKDSNLCTECVGKIDNNGKFEKFLQSVSRSHELNCIEFVFAKISMSFQKLYYKYLNFFAPKILWERDDYDKGSKFLIMSILYVVSICFIPSVQLNLSTHLNNSNVLILNGILIFAILSSVSFYAALPFHLMALPLEMYTQNCHSILFAPQMFFSTCFVLFPPINYSELQSFKHKTNKMWNLPYTYQKQIRKEQPWKTELFTFENIIVKFVSTFFFGFILNIFFLPFLCPNCPGECL